MNRAILRSPAARAAAVLSILIIAEGTLYATFNAGLVGGLIALGLHVAIVVTFACAWHRVFDADLTICFLFVLLGVSAGPVGIVGVLIIQLVAGRSRVSRGDLDQWYRQISGVADENATAVVIYDQLIDGRSRSPQSLNIDYFPGILHGALSQQQALLGLIGLSYHPDYRPLLMQALSSAEPSIRVHAAAVAVKLRTRARYEFARLNSRSSEGASPTDISAWANILVTQAEGGFLDQAESGTAMRRAEKLCRGALRDFGPNLQVSALLCRVLAGRGRWEELRAEIGSGADVRTRQRDRLGAQCLMELGRARDLHELLEKRDRATASRTGGRHVACA